jgi:hypothetical protein
MHVRSMPSSTKGTAAATSTPTRGWILVTYLLGQVAPVCGVKDQKPQLHDGPERYVLVQTVGASSLRSRVSTTIIDQRGPLLKTYPIDQHYVADPR